MTRETITINPLDFDPGYFGEFNNSPSLTVPDQTLSIREILDRYARGLPTEGMSNGLYDDNLNEDDPDYLPDPRRLDLAEREQYKQMITSELQELKNKLNELAKKANEVSTTAPPSTGA